MQARNFVSSVLGVVLIAGCAAVPSFAQGQYPPPQYPPDNQQQTQYPQEPPPPGQYPPAQGQYPPQQGQYPPPQAQYPAQQGQYPPPQYAQPPMYPPQQLDQMVEPIALYPDGLLAEVLTAATFYNEIPDAAGWANAHAYLRGDALARAIQEDRLPWDQSVLALLPFPNVLSYMARYMGWTQELGNAVLSERPAVMDAVQRMRQQAYNYGYLRDSPYQRVEMVGPGDIEIVPVSPGMYYVPYYNPYVVFARPRPGFAVGGAIRFGPGITVGAFAPWGWGGVGFGWRDHNILVDHRPWGHTWANRQQFVRPYAPGPRAEHHEIRREERERHDDRRDHR